MTHRPLRPRGQRLLCSLSKNVKLNVNYRVQQVVAIKNASKLCTFKIILNQYGIDERGSRVHSVKGLEALPQKDLKS